MKCEERLLLTGVPRCRTQSAWINKEEEMQPITIHVNIHGRKITALVDLEMDENYIY